MGRTRPEGGTRNGAAELDGKPPVTMGLDADPVASAQAAGLRYVADTEPGIRRRRSGRHFAYLGLDGKPIREPETLRRIRSLDIPPAWTDVWICPSPHGHLQATGRDAKGRKQYRYHPRWREVRDQTKYDRMIAFGEALPRIRARVAHDLELPGMPREKILAAVVRLLETTCIRVGNEEYARVNHSYGLTTLRNRHVDVSGATLRFHFRGKSGKRHDVGLHDRRLARIVKRCREIPGQHLFQYQDEIGECHAIGSGEVNDYLREIGGQELTAKEFRTWMGTLLAVRALRQIGVCECQTQARKNILQAINTVAECLGNTRAVCRKYYVHPTILDAYLEGSLPQPCPDPESAEPSRDLHPEEDALLAFLRLRLTPEPGPAAPLHASDPNRSPTVRLGVCQAGARH
jgi:DNA topoisomerase I